MYVEKCYRTFDWNFWGNNWSSYTVTVNDIQSKWYYPGDKPNPLLCLGTKWDLAREMNNMFIKMTEVDPIGEEKHDETYTFKKSTNLIFDSPNEDGESFKLDLGIDDEESQLIHVTYTIPTGPDDLKPSEINYSDNYIIAKGKKNNKSGYYLKAIGNVYYSVTILPIDMRNEFAVKQALLNRKKRNNQ